MKNWWRRLSDEACPRCNSQAGFTLMELLIVMAVILILMLVAIPSLLNMTIHAHETSALASLHAIQDAEVQYTSTYPANGYACSLATLGGAAGSGPPSPQAAQLLQGTLAAGLKDGYIFKLVNCSKAQGANNQDIFTSYEVTAVPQTVGKTGNRGFCMDMTGEIKVDMAGGTNCSVSLQ